MGYSANWTNDSWRSFKTSNKIDNQATADTLLNTGSVNDKYLPFKVNRESRDSDLHPNSGSIIIGVDTTGSMNRVIESVFKRLNVCVEEIFNRIKEFDPQLMMAAIDDYEAMKWCGTTPALQVTQFEVDIRIAEQLKELKLTGMGAGNGYESYPLLWYFASRHTSIDCYEKRGKKGVLITMGDDGLQGTISRGEVKTVFGDDIPEDISTEALYREVSKKYDVYHLLIEEGSTYSRRVEREWRDMLGEHAIPVSNLEMLPEIIVSIVQASMGHDIDKIVDSWDGSTKLVVKEAISGLSVQNKEENGLWRP